MDVSIDAEVALTRRQGANLSIVATLWVGARGHRCSLRCRSSRQFLYELETIDKERNDRRRNQMLRRLLMRYGRVGAPNVTFTCSTVEVGRRSLGMKMARLSVA